jgi:general secretion pathway protein B
MSFILDALRKSEHERQRQTGPALAEVPVAAPKPRSNVWGPLAIALLLVNLVVIGVLLIRKSMRDPVAPTPAAAIVDTAPASTGPAPGAVPSIVTGNASAAPAPAAPRAMPRPVEPVPAETGAARNPLEAETADGPPMLDPQMVAQAAAAPPGPPAVTRAPTSRGSVVYESLPDSATIGPQRNSPQAGTGRPAAGSGSGLSSADELTASGAVPGLNLDLHVYSMTPAERLVFVNSRKYREGDTLQEGPVVRQITPAGVVLEFNGRSYLLTHN